MNIKKQRPKFSICIPAYNRARHLTALLDSIFAQSNQSFEIVICEDQSPERTQIAMIVNKYIEKYPGRLLYYENEQNLGYDGNIRNLVSKANGEYCFFMGNDDIMCKGALHNVQTVLETYPNVGLVLKSYAWFDGDPDHVNQTVRYFSDEHFMNAGMEAISVCYRRAGVISGYIVHRDLANQAATDEFDGTLYYQMHLTAYVLARMPAVSTPETLVLCRNGEPPDFGNSGSEKGIFTPGRYTPAARIRMITGVITILQHHHENGDIGNEVVEAVMKDYANYFYPYIKDQLELSIGEFWALYRSFAQLGFARYPMFHLYFLVGYILGERRFDNLTRLIRAQLGRSPHFGLKN
ncbi:glycosyltransferase family 2 protein [Noviherbaspirillum sedimenti]|uniref:Glycosyltransferase family 2 protein n=1 Tax=Noviherbaspirillum sedimenti TaxID=2320865 RepID=A0A3A3G0S0_9BURK|nr:glycosyltransferase family A protein [Noviherbaspirillum sedimenti]RJG02047.1 glycosyltransferase family 2 protein [Noviherbaspirillum sedimenti]